MTSQPLYEDPDDFLRIDPAPAEPGGPVVLHVRGDLDRDTADLLTSTFGQHLITSRAARVEVSLAEVRFVDAAGARCLLSCRKAAEAAGATMTVRDPSPPVVRVLDALRLLDRLGLAGEPGPEARVAGATSAHAAPATHGPENPREQSAKLRRAAQELTARAREVVDQSRTIRGAGG
ncbi:STAS domain-containing protein [Catenuloplanes indicus]|uniref:Anti-anti-sigma factor n=1 Tax=Catenuloplanes indicus TaxID=137267 RepID=A0AAE3VW71_9ACTN|nr:STAS domain-containing protein [Catenuloplanes indicus]MDQ0364135.1 anti-anti-sigma factor [Catenuloplanes indicus]